ncbi:hypothetical protein ACT7C4_14145 [Bacillus pacificus]
MDEVIGEVVAGICEFVVEVTVDAIGHLVSGNDEEKRNIIIVCKSIQMIKLKRLISKEKSAFLVFTLY